MTIKGGTVAFQLIRSSMTGQLQSATSLPIRIVS